MNCEIMSTCSYEYYNAYFVDIGKYMSINLMKSIVAYAFILLSSKKKKLKLIQIVVFLLQYTSIYVISQKILPPIISLTNQPFRS